MKLAQWILKLDDHVHGLAKTWTLAGATLIVLLGPCAWYRRYKASHPDGLARYV